MWTSLTNANPGLYAGLFVPDSSTYDQIFFLQSIAVTGTSAPAAGNKMGIPVSLTNSVLWVPLTLSSAHHLNAFTGSFTDSNSSGSFAWTNNVMGTMGIQAPSIAGVNMGGTPGTASTFAFSGNVELCGYNGYGTVPQLFLDNGNIASVTITDHNNTSCAWNTNLATDQSPMGNVGAEGFTLAAGTVASINSNLYFRNDAGGPIAEVCDAVNAGYAATPWITLLTNNAIFNTNTAATPVCANSTSWIVTGPQNDVVVQSRPPVLVEPNRSLPLFDSEYLTPAGILNTSSYSATTWTSGNSYSVGNYVSDSQAGVWGGKTTYWRCIQAHTAGTTNRPVTGVDSSNPYYGQNGYWELAFMPWMRSAILAGTTYTDGAINANGVYAVGLLNAWLRQGMTSMEPSLWNGCLSGAECGAIQLTPIQHLPPPAAVI